MEPIVVLMKGKLRRYFSFITVTPVLVAVSIAGLTLLVMALIEYNIGSVQRQSVNRQLQENQLLVKSRLSGYAHVAQGGAAFASASQVNQASWINFMDAFRVTENYPLVRAVMLSQQVPRDQMTALRDKLSTEYGRSVVDNANSTQSNANIVSYVFPDINRVTAYVGTDLQDDPTLREALSKSTDDASPVIAYLHTPLELPVTRQPSSPPSMLTVSAYYDPSLPNITVDERRAAVRGHVISAYAPSEVLASIFESTNLEHVNIRAYAESVKPENLIYTALGKNVGEISGRATQKFEVFGLAFVMTYEYDRNYLVPPGQRGIPLVATAFGGIMAIVAGLVMYIFLRARQRGMQLDKERDISRAKDELLSIASHQMRTPATGVKQYLGMVLQGFAGNLTNSQSELLSKAYASNERQLRVVNDVLHLAKLDLGRVVLAKSTFDLTGMVRDIVEEQSQDSQKGKVTVHLKLLKKAPIYADQHALRMVVENIVSNAIKYTDQGGRVSLRLRRHKGDYILTVADTGVGIAKDDMDKLFKQFSRITNERSHLVSGTGVGLYLARHLTRLHGGDVTVSSAPGKGSSFYITLPIRRNL